MENLDNEKVNKNIWKRCKTEMDENNETENPDKSQDKVESKRRCDYSQSPTFPRTSFTMPLIRVPKVEEWCSNTYIILTGTACRVGTGLPVGALDIGVSKYSFYFCIAMPGVKKDPGEFSCEIHQDGKVCVSGVTSTGGKTVLKYSRVFEMKCQQQCPPGPFMLSFILPGPVDPRLFSPSFRSDGIFEGVVAKL